MPIKSPIAGVLAKRTSGFTLIEVMITVAIVCILSAIAMPTYSNFLIRGHRAVAQAYLTDIAMKQQQYLLDSRTYAATLIQLNMSVPSSVSAHYTITIDNSATPPLFAATATPIVGTRQASDGTLSINNVGAKLPAGSW